MSVLDQLTEVLEQRKSQDPETSYVAAKRPLRSFWRPRMPRVIRPKPPTS
jgi:hypothetical protein